MASDPPTTPPVVVEAPIPATPRSFAEFGVSEQIVEALALRDFHATFPIQALVLRDAISGRDVRSRSSRA
jgi:superfamily II DNA/RNA helicase